MRSSVDCPSGRRRISYSEQEIVDLLAAARRLGPTPGLRGAVYETLFGLIASTGLRISEALALRNADVDLKQRDAHHSPDQVRQVAPGAHASQHASRPCAAIAGCATWPADPLAGRGPVLRRHARPTTGHAPRRPPGAPRLRATCAEQLGWRNRGAHHAPRIHDLRHTFVVRRIMLWQAQGVDIDQAMLSLSTYVGHAMVTNTYWYLSAVPELMALAAGRFESFMAQVGRCTMRKTPAPKPPSFAALVQQFFTEYLVAQRAVSPRTVACYRDALMLFLDFASRKLGKEPTTPAAGRHPARADPGLPGSSGAGAA